MMMIVPALAINLVAIVAVMLLLWRYSVSIQDVSFIDAVWAYGMVFLAGLSVAQAGGISGPYGWALLILTATWGLRLGTHLLGRWRRLGRDPRYERIVGGKM
jgi:steroid 5-alpha reductase family enzyme